MSRAAFPSGRKSLLLFAVTIAVIGGVWWWVSPPADPVCDGVRLSDWVAYHHGSWTSLLDAKQRGARLAAAPERGPRKLQEFGPGAVTWLSYWVEHATAEKEVNWYRNMRTGPRLFDRAPDWLRRGIPVRWGGLRAPPQLRRDFAADALAQFGPAAARAVPALARILEDKDERAFYNVACALHAIGPASWPAVRQLLEHGSKPARMALLSSMARRMGDENGAALDADVAPVIEALAKASRDPDAAIRFVALETIAACQRKRGDLVLPDAMLPELIQLLSDSEHAVRGPAAELLALFGAKAAPAIPRLIELLDDENSRVRDRAAWSLARVDLGEKRSGERLRIMLRDDDPTCREQASKTLATLGLSTGR